MWNVGLIEVGVDNIITDRPAHVRSLLEAWNDLSDSKRLALMLRDLIVVIDRTPPSEL